MNAWVVALAIIGGLFIAWFFLVPIAEAILFGYMTMLMIALSHGRKTLHPRHWWWLIRWPWVMAASRLFGVDYYTSSQSEGNWEHVPPFTLRRMVQLGDDEE